MLLKDIPHHKFVMGNIFASYNLIGLRQQRFPEQYDYQSRTTSTLKTSGLSLTSFVIVKEEAPVTSPRGSSTCLKTRGTCGIFQNWCVLINRLYHNGSVDKNVPIIYHWHQSKTAVSTKGTHEQRPHRHHH